MTSRFLVDPSGGSTSTDPTLVSKVKQCYNNITVNTNNITLENTDSGVSKTVAVSGGSSSTTIAYNSVSVSGNDIVFGKTDGNTDSEPLGGLTAITDLEALTTNHTTDITALEALTNGLVVSDITTNTTDITDFEAREQFKNISKHPDLTDAQISADNVTVNGRTYVFDQSSAEWFGGWSGSGYRYGRLAFRTGAANWWETERVSNHEYQTLDSGDKYDYSGTSSIGGIDGEWISVQFPEPIIVNSFTMGFHNSQDPVPYKFKLLCSNNGTSWNTLNCFDENGDSTSIDGVTLTSSPESTFNTSTDDSEYGQAFTHWAIVVTQIKAGTGLESSRRNFAVADIKFFSVSKDVAKCIKANDETFNDANITESGGTWYLNLEREGAANDLQLELPTSGTTAGFNPAAIEVVTYGQTSTANSKPFIETTTQGNSTTQVELFDGFVSAVKDGDSIKLTTEAGNDVVVGPFSNGGGGGASSTTNYPTSAMTSNALPSPLVAVGSTEYNLFTDKLFGSDNLGNLGEIDGDHIGTAGPVEYWAFDPSDGNVIVAFIDATNLKMIKIDQSGVHAYPATYPERYISTPSPLPASAADLISHWNSYSGSGGHLYTFTKHALFDLAVNNRPAYHAFDQDATTEWVSHSNTYKPTTTVIDFSAYIDKTVEYAQADLNNHYAVLQPQFLVDAAQVPATSSTCFFEQQKTSYTADEGGINYWHYTTGTQPPTTFRVVPDADGTITIVYGGLWHDPSVPDVYIAHTPVGGTTTTYSTNLSKETETFSVSKNDEINIYETDGVLALYSISFTRSTEVGDYIGGFSGTPPATINLTGTWGTNGYNLKRTSYTTPSVVYNLYNPAATHLFAGYGIVFTLVSQQLRLYLNDATHGYTEPTTFTINGNAASEGDVVNANDVIQLILSGVQGPTDTFTVPSELAFGKKLAANTDAGEYLKIDLGSQLEATTLNLTSVAEYKEPRINMTGFSQCGYEATVSSGSPSANQGYLAFNNLTTPHGDRWIAGANKYDTTSGAYVGTGGYARLSTDYPSTGTNPQTAAGEYIMIKLPDKRKLVAYKLTREDSTITSFSPQEFTLYARETNTSDWVNISAESLTTSTIMGNYTTGGGTRYPSTGDLTPTTAYQYYAVVVTAIWASNFGTFALSEFELYCLPAEIEEFKLYGSPDNSSWTEICYATAANITSSGTDFTITNPGLYQYYGLVITKNYGYHNVSLAEMKLGSSGAVDLSNYYTKTETYSKAELDPRIAKVKGTVSIGLDATGLGNGILVYDNDYKILNVTREHYNGINTSVVWGGLNTTYAVYEHKVHFEANVFNDDDDYVVLLSPHCIGGLAYGVNRVMSLEIKEKHHTYFITTCYVYENIAAHPSTNLPWGFDFVVF